MKELPFGSVVAVGECPSLKALKVFIATLTTEVSCIVEFVNQASFCQDTE